jgi:ATP-dependent Clp protease ATP-binding subunit ClpX
MGEIDNNGKFFCSFCGKEQGETKKLVTGESESETYICDECTKKCYLLVTDADESVIWPKELGRLSLKEILPKVVEIGPSLDLKNLDLSLEDFMKKIIEIFFMSFKYIKDIEEAQRKEVDLTKELEKIERELSEKKSTSVKKEEKSELKSQN